MQLYHRLCAQCDAMKCHTMCAVSRFKAQHSNTLNPFKSIWIHSQPTRISRVFWHGWSCISFAFVRSSEYFHMIHIWYLWILFIFVYICLDLVQVNKILISITRINLLHVFISYMWCYMIFHAAWTVQDCPWCTLRSLPASETLQQRAARRPTFNKHLEPRTDGRAEHRDIVWYVMICLSFFLI